MHLCIIHHHTLGACLLAPRVSGTWRLGDFRLVWFPDPFYVPAWAQTLKHSKPGPGGTVDSAVSSEPPSRKANRQSLSPARAGENGGGRNFAHRPQFFLPYFTPLLSPPNLPPPFSPFSSSPWETKKLHRRRPGKRQHVLLRLAVVNGRHRGASSSISASRQRPSMLWCQKHTTTLDLLFRCGLRSCSSSLDPCFSVALLA